MPCTPPSAGVAFNEPTLNASPCNFQIQIPLPKLNIVLPPIPFPPFPLPVFSLNLAISCSLDNPIDVSAGLSFGGGRSPCYDTSFDDEPD